jgi:hypothetical protein
MIVPIHSIKTPLAPLSLNLMPVTRSVGMHMRNGDFFPSIHPGLHSHAERGNEKQVHEFRDAVGVESSLGVVAYYEYRCYVENRIGKV